MVNKSSSSLERQDLALEGKLLQSYKNPFLKSINIFVRVRLNLLKELKT